MSWFKQNAPGSATPYAMGRPSPTAYAKDRMSPTPYAAQRMSPTPYQGASAGAGQAAGVAAKAGKGGMGGFLAAPFANPFGKEKRGAVKDILTSNPFGGKARGAVGTVTGLWGGNDAPRGGGTVRAYQPPATIGAMAPPVTMRGPDGSTRQVSMADVQKYRTMGAEVVG